MSRTRTVYSAEFKTRLVLELLKEDKTLTQIASKNNITPKNLQNWKKIFLNNAVVAMEPAKAEEYDNIDDVKKDLNKFLIYYNFNRRHGSLKKELKVRTPFDAVQSWFQTKPEIFKILPDVFQHIAFEMVQRGET